MPAQPRPYRQVARAAAARDTQDRIVSAFAVALQTRWMDEITLDDIAATAGTTRQTVIRLFGGKKGLLGAVAQHMGQEVAARRALPAAATPSQATRALLADYEISGDTVTRLLAQEDRHPELTAILTIGRRQHREWVATTFAHALPRRQSARREALITQLAIVTDVYTWKLLRRDFGHAATDAESLIADMIAKLLNHGEST